MCAAKSSPYSKSNSSWPLFSAGQAVVKPLRRGVAQDGGAELLVDQDAGLRLGHAGGDRGLEAVVDHLLGRGDLARSARRRARRVQPNIFVWNEPRWSKGRMYSGLSKPEVVMRSP